MRIVERMIAQKTDGENMRIAVSASRSPPRACARSMCSDKKADCAA